MNIAEIFSESPSGYHITVNAPKGVDASIKYVSIACCASSF